MAYLLPAARSLELRKTSSLRPSSHASAAEAVAGADDIDAPAPLLHLDMASVLGHMQAASVERRLQELQADAAAAAAAAAADAVAADFMRHEDEEEGVWGEGGVGSSSPRIQVQHSATAQTLTLTVLLPASEPRYGQAPAPSSPSCYSPLGTRMQHGRSAHGSGHSSPSTSYPPGLSPSLSPSQRSLQGGLQGHAGRHARRTSAHAACPSPRPMSCRAPGLSSSDDMVIGGVSMTAVEAPLHALVQQWRQLEERAGVGGGDGGGRWDGGGALGWGEGAKMAVPISGLILRIDNAQGSAHQTRQASEQTSKCLRPSRWWLLPPSFLPILRSCGRG